MFGLGAPEIILIVLVILIFFGAKKIPEMAQGIGKGIREFRKAAKDAQAEIEGEESIATIAQKAKCPYCSAPVSEGVRFCPTCGKPLQDIKCPKCSKLNPPGSKFCVECGGPLST